MGTGSYLYGTEIHFGSVPSREGATRHSESIWREILGEIRSLGMNSPNFSCLPPSKGREYREGSSCSAFTACHNWSLLQTETKLNMSSKAGNGAIQGALKFSPKGDRSSPLGCWKVELALHPWKPFLQSPRGDKGKATLKPLSWAQKPSDTSHLDQVGVWIKLDKAAHTLLSPVNNERCGSFLSELNYVLLVPFLLVYFCHLVVKRQSREKPES